MKLRTLCVGIGTLLCGILISDLIDPALFAPKTPEQARVVGKGDQGNLRIAWQRWLAGYASMPRQRIQVGLVWNKGLSADYSPARGIAEIDLQRARVRVRISDDDAKASNVWLVERPRSPDSDSGPGDRSIRVGTLIRDANGTWLNAPVDRDTLASMEVTWVAVTRAGETPASGGLLFGSVSLFQKLYHYPQDALRAGTRHPTGLSLIGSAHAAGITPPGFPDAALINDGRRIFFNETFDGNGRTCGTCHPETNNFTIDPRFIATLPADDPLFVAERPQPNPLAANFEKPDLMRKVGLILINSNGFDDLTHNFTMRGVPHLLSMRTSVSPPTGGNDGTTLPPDERTGWAGDGAPTDLTLAPFLHGTLRDFAVGAIRQHLTKTLNRQPGVDFRLPTDYELDALEAFILSLGRQQEFDDLHTIRMLDERADRGRLNYLGEGLANGTPCNACHFNGGANTDPTFDFPANITPPAFESTNRSFQPRVEELLDQHGDIVDAANNPFDDGFGHGTNLFNVPTVIEAADTGPFFHGNEIDTVEGLVSFYSSQRHLRDGEVLPPIVGLNGAQVANVGAFLRVLNADENARSAIDLIDRARLLNRNRDRKDNLTIARSEIGDAIEVLNGGRLHFADAVPLFQQAQLLAYSPLTMGLARDKLIEARKDMIQRPD